MHRYLLCLVALAGASSAAGAIAETDTYRITSAERAACTPDAERLCLATYPDEDKLVGCMKANRTALSPACGAAFDAGMKRRGLN